MKRFLKNLTDFQLAVLSVSIAVTFLSSLFQLINDGFGITIGSVYLGSNKQKIIACVLLIALLSYVLYLFLNHRKKISRKVFLLVPKTSAHTTQSRKDDVALIKNACNEFMTSSEGSQGIFEIIEDDLDNTNTLEKIISEKTNSGYKYFVSFFSDISKSLSTNWSYRKSGKENPILVCTVTSSEEIKTSRNLIYRFYIRSEDEAKCLASRCFKDSTLLITRVTYLAEGVSKYGKSAVETFKKEWEGRRKREFIEGEFITEGNSIDAAIQKIKSKIDKKSVSAIFIALYGNNIKDFIKSWDTACNGDKNLEKIKLIFTSTFMVYDWIKDCLPEIKKHELITCLPEKDNHNRYWNGTDIDNLKGVSIVKDFVMETLAKMKKAIDRTENAEMFHLYWLDSRDENDKFEYYILKNGDSKIFLDSYRIEKGVNKN